MTTELKEMIEKLDEQVQEKKQKRAKRTEEVLTNSKPKSVRKLTKKEQQILALAEQTVLPDYYHIVWTHEDLDELCNWLAEQPRVAVDTETMGVNPFKDEIVGISFYAPQKGYYIPLKHVEDVENDVSIRVFDGSGFLRVGVDYVKCLDKVCVAERIKPLLEDRDKKFIGHNSKFDSHVLYNWMGIDIRWYFDTMVAQALLDENKSKALKDLAPLYLKIEADTYSELFGKTTFDKIPILLNPETRTGCLAGYYAIKDTELTYKLAEFQEYHLNRPRLEKIRKLFFEVEMPFLQIVVEAERHGVAMDTEYLENKVAVELRTDLEKLKQKIWAVTGQINLNSPVQLAEALYVKLGLPRVNEKSPNSTDNRTLKRLKKHHEVISDIIEYRQKAKLVQAFAEKLPKAVINGRIHTSFNTAGTKTGRMSSQNPNLQQIPAKVGPLIRNAFIADDGRLLASLDFSQQELRVLAHVSQDKTLLEIYRDGKDVHSMTAVGMWNRKNPSQQLTYEQFEAVRGLIGVITDADGNFDPDRVNEERIKPLKDAGYTELTDEVLSELVALAKQLEVTRKMAKVVSLPPNPAQNGGG